MAKKLSKEEKDMRWRTFLKKLEAMPPEKLSKTAKWVLKTEKEREEQGITYSMDMRALLR